MIQIAEATENMKAEHSNVVLKLNSDLMSLRKAHSQLQREQQRQQKQMEAQLQEYVRELQTKEMELATARADCEAAATQMSQLHKLISVHVLGLAVVPEPKPASSNPPMVNKPRSASAVTPSTASSSSSSFSTLPLSDGSPTHANSSNRKVTFISPVVQKVNSLKANGEHERANIPSVVFPPSMAASSTSSSSNSSSKSNDQDEKAELQASVSKPVVPAAPAAPTQPMQAATSALPALAIALSSMPPALSVGNMSLQDTFDLVRQKIEMMVQTSS